MEMWIWIAVSLTGMAFMVVALAKWRNAIAQQAETGVPPRQFEPRWAVAGIGIMVSIAIWLVVMPPPLWILGYAAFLPLVLPRMARRRISEQMIWNLVALFVALLITLALVQIFVLDL